MANSVKKIRTDHGDLPIDYDSLMNKPKIPTTPQDIGAQPAGSYLTRETDPTVPSWAKQKSKPTYTAEEVGAQPAGNYITREIDPTVPSWAKQSTKPKYTAKEIGAQPAGDYALKSEIPKNTSDLVNDSGFITSADVSTKSSVTIVHSSDGSKADKNASQIHALAQSGSEIILELNGEYRYNLYFHDSNTSVFISLSEDKGTGVTYITQYEVNSKGSIIKKNGSIPMKANNMVATVPSGLPSGTPKNVQGILDALNTAIKNSGGSGGSGEVVCNGGKWMDGFYTVTSSESTETKVVERSGSSVEQPEENTNLIVQFTTGNTSDNVKLNIAGKVFTVVKNPWSEKDIGSGSKIGFIPKYHLCVFHIKGQYAYWINSFDNNYGVLVVSLVGSSSNYTSDYKASEIIKHIQNGGSSILKYHDSISGKDIIYNYDSIVSGEVCYSVINLSNNKVSKTNFYVNNSKGARLEEVVYSSSITWNE